MSPTGTTITAAEAIAAHAAHRATLIDVRSPEEIRANGTVPGALCIPTLKLSEALTPGRPGHRPEIGQRPVTIVFCAIGARAEAAADLLRRAGMAGVVNMGAFRDWVEAGGPVHYPD